MAEKSTIELRLNSFPTPFHKGPGKKFHILLVFWSVTGVATADTFRDMCRWMCLFDETKSGAILLNFWLPRI
jgi:hypothetical protein